MKFDNLVGAFGTTSPNANIEDCINWYVERMEGADGKNPFRLFKRPGYKDLPTPFAVAASIARGCLSLNGHAFFAIGDTVYDILDDGTIAAAYGPIDNDDKQVTFAANNYQLALVSANKAYYIQSGALAEVPWLVDTAVSCCDFLTQYFLFLAVPSGTQGNGFFFSEPGDVATGSVFTNFTAAQASASNCTRLTVQSERVFVHGDQVTQVFFDNSAANPEDPFPQDFSATIPQGTAAPASVTAFDNALGWIGRSTAGQGIAWRNNGAQAVRISTFAVEEAWRQYATIADAVGWTTIFKGHTVWRIWFPTADMTWQYDASLPANLAWTKALYFNPDSGVYEADRGSCACEVNGRVMVGDRANGKVYEMSLDALSDNGTRIRCLRRAPIITEENKLIALPWIELDMLTGQGDDSNGDPNLGAVTPEFDPQMMLRISHDWGQNWGSERMRSTGKKGEFGKRVIWRGNGSGRQTVLEFTYTANTPCCLNNCYLRQPKVRKT